jgi:hypothetical protein
MFTQLTEGAKNHEVCKFWMFRVVPRKWAGKADSADAWHALRPIILAAYTLQELNNVYPVLTCTQFMAAQIYNFQILLHLFSFSFQSLCGAQFGNICFMTKNTCPFKICVLQVQSVWPENVNAVKLLKCLCVATIWVMQYVFGCLQ